jgi:pimeloyl-ACP methyl ester carboxylesterase
LLRRYVLAVLLAIGWTGLAAAPGAAQHGAGHDSHAGDGDHDPAGRIAVTVTGEGPDVVLIPGLTSQPRIWESTVAAVPGYRYHLVHVAGFAGKPVGANATGPVLEPLAHAIHEYIRDNKLTRPAVVGHSMGGSIGMILASHHPDSVGKLMIVDMMPFLGAMFGPPGATAEQVRPIADAMMKQSAAQTPDQRKAFMTAMVGGMTNVDAERPAILADSVASDPGLVGRAYHQLIVTDLRPDLEGIAAPTTVLYVTPKGAPISDAQMDGYYKASYANLKNAKLVRVPDSAHFIMLDAPERFRKELKDLLE